MSGSLLETRGLTLTFGGVTALDDVSSSRPASCRHTAQKCGEDVDLQLSSRRVRPQRGASCWMDTSWSAAPFRVAA